MPKTAQPAVLTVDFTNVGERREGGRSAHIPEGDYLFKAVGYEIKDKKDEDSQYISWKCQPWHPEKYQSKGFCYHVTSLKPGAEWQLRNFLEDLGVVIQKSITKVPLKKIAEKGLIFGGTVEDDEYNGKVKSKIVATFKKSLYEAMDADDEEDEEEEEEEEVEETPAPAKKKTKKPVEEEEEEEDEDLEELDVDDI